MNKTIQMLRASFTILCLALSFTSYIWAQHSGDLKASAARFLDEHEPKLQQITNPIERHIPLRHLAAAALAAGEMEKAGAYAQ